MNNIATSYKRNGVTVMGLCHYYGVSIEDQAPYQYPKGHPCHGCPYTLQTNVASCMFPKRKGNGCFWHDLNLGRKPKLPQKTAQQEAADRIYAFLEVLERVKERKGYK